MTLAAFTGNQALTFSDYLDLGTGKTLHAEPGGTYDITPASGAAAADIPAPWFVPAGGPVAAAEGLAEEAVYEPPPEVVPEPQPEGEPEGSELENQEPEPEGSELENQEPEPEGPPQ